MKQHKKVLGYNKRVDIQTQVTMSTYESINTNLATIKMKDHCKNRIEIELRIEKKIKKIQASIFTCVVHPLSSILPGPGYNRKTGMTFSYQEVWLIFDKNWQM